MRRQNDLWECVRSEIDLAAETLENLAGEFKELQPNSSERASRSTTNQRSGTEGGGVAFEEEDNRNDGVGEEEEQDGNTEE